MLLIGFYLWPLIIPRSATKVTPPQLKHIATFAARRLNVWLSDFDTVDPTQKNVSS